MAVIILMIGCSQAFLPPAYSLKFPQIPEHWEEILGKPHWKIEWINGGGKKSLSVSETLNIKVDIASSFSNVVIAMPFWPEKGIEAGVFKPAGAIFPFDVSSESLVLSWQGGIEAVLYNELAAAYNAGGDNSASVPRQPQYFDWPRFRLLFSDTSVNAEFREDPWLADMQNIALRIVQSGFDKRRLVPESRGSLNVPVSPGPWIGASPFSGPLFFEGSPIFPVRPTVDTWVSKEGILRCNAQIGRAHA